MATIYIDGQKYEVSGGDNLLHACLSLGLDVPYFCWHPALGSVGACRQCAVKQFKDADDKQGRLVMSCMTPASSDMFISIADEEAKNFRASVVEWLMTNHPHDCPVCEEGGHCHLQDMTVMTGHAARRYRFTKRTHKNQDLGPFVGHEMNRCIACYRCVRYYKDYAGGTDLGVFGAHDNVYFGRIENGTLESEFSGNLTEVCPTGVFTDKTHSERYNRKWDMQFAPSVCQSCAVGCNTSPGERYGELRRIENRYNGVVNHYFLCDRGRFGYGYVNRKDRPKHPQACRDGRLVPASVDNALAGAAEALRHAQRTIGIGSPRASLETNFALRELVGADNFYAGVGQVEFDLINRVLAALTQGPARTPALREIEHCDAILVLGEDVSNTAPRIALALRQAVKGRAVELAAAAHIESWQNEAVQHIGAGARHPLFVASTDATRIDDIAVDCFRAAPEDIARLGFAVAAALDASAPVVADLDEAFAGRVQHIADALRAAKKPLIVAGTGLECAAVIDAAASVSRALHALNPATALSLSVPEANSLGLAMLGGSSLDRALDAAIGGHADALVVVETDLYYRAPQARVDAALAAAKTVIVLDHQHHATSDRATFSFPAASFAEGDGTLISNEGRAQRFFQVYDPAYYDPACEIRESWRWLSGLKMVVEGRSPGWRLLDDVTAACAAAYPQLGGIREAAPNAQFRMNGLKISREPHRYSGRTAMRANLAVSEPRAPQDADTALAYSMEGHNGTQAGNRPGSLIPFAWAPGWNSPQSWNKFQDEVGGHLKKGDPGVRLIEPTGEGAYADTIPEAFVAREASWRVVPQRLIFGGEELTQRAAPIASRMPDATVSLSPTDAARLGAAAGALVDVWFDSGVVRLPLHIAPGLAIGTVALPLGLPGIPPLGATGWVKLSQAAIV